MSQLGRAPGLWITHKLGNSAANDDTNVEGATGTGMPGPRTVTLTDTLHVALGLPNASARRWPLTTKVDNCQECLGYSPAILTWAEVLAS